MQDAHNPTTEPVGPVRSGARVVWEYILTLAVMAVLVFSARSSLADWYEVPTGSMLPTIQLGDRIFVNKLAYDLRVPFTSISLMKLGEPQRGDIVVFVHPESRIDYVKRLIGLPGDTIEIRQNVLYINGKPMEREEVAQERLPAGAAHDRSSTLYVEQVFSIDHFVFERDTEDWPPTVVPDDMYFMLGDNRDNSSDSRAWGFVPRENLRGRALRVVLSFDYEHPFLSRERVRWGRSMLSLISPVGSS